MGMTEPRIRRRRPGGKTYSHLLTRGRMPTEYEVASSVLLYHLHQGTAVDNPVVAWMRAHQVGSALRGTGWEQFADPREMTYFSYCALQRERQAILDDLFRRASAAGAPAPAGWVRERRELLGALRFVFHALGMCAAYIGSMAPAGTIVIAAALQCANEIGRIEAMAQYLYAVEVPVASPEHRRARVRALVAESRESWERHPRWQALRNLLEGLLVTYDWSEQFVATNLVVKPLLDAWCVECLTPLAKDAGDVPFAEVFTAFEADGAWQRAWSLRLATMAREMAPDNARVLRGWMNKWLSEAEPALGPLVGEGGGALGSAFHAHVAAALQEGAV